MSRRFRLSLRLIAQFAVTLVLLLGARATSAYAHESRTIAGGKYAVEAGWDIEPAMEGQPNAVHFEIRLAGADPEQPVEGAEKTLHLRVRQGASSKEFTLRPSPQEKGTYLADLTPTRAGDYQFIVVGTIGQDAINETFDSADGKFDTVKSPADIQFPVSVGSVAEVGTVARDAQAEAQANRALAYFGIAMSVLALLAVAVLWLRVVARQRAPHQHATQQDAAQ